LGLFLTNGFQFLCQCHALEGAPRVTTLVIASKRGKHHSRASSGQLLRDKIRQPHLVANEGEEAALAYLIDRYGLGSPAHQAALAAREDARRWVALQQGLYEELDALYALGLPPDEALARKGALFASVPDRIVAAGLSEPERYLRSVARNPWNNARLIQFRTYNDDRPSFEALLQAEGGDLVRFLSAVKRITRGAPDPFAALRAAVSGAPVHPNH
jgi:hypothetical protein